MGDLNDEECADQVMKFEFVIDAKNDHVGFGFVNKGFDRFETGSSDWGFGTSSRSGGSRKLILYYSDRDFKICTGFTDMNGNRLQFEAGAHVHMSIDCKTAVARIWVGENEGTCVKCGLAKEFAIAVSMGGSAGTKVTLLQQEIESISSVK